MNFLFYFICLLFVLLFPINVFFRRYYYRKNIKNSNFKALLAAFGSGMAVVLVFSFLYVRVIHPLVRSKTFEAHEWKTNEPNRYKMVANLIESKLLVGKSKVEVITLLGNHYELGPCSNCIGYATFEPCQGFSIDHEVLEVIFNEQNIVTLVNLNAY